MSQTSDLQSAQWQILELNVCVQIPWAWNFGSLPKECQEFRRQLLTRVNWFKSERWLHLLLTMVVCRRSKIKKMMWEDCSKDVWWMEGSPTPAQMNSALITGSRIAFYSWLLSCGSLTAPTSYQQPDRDVLSDDIKWATWWFDLLSIRKKYLLVFSLPAITAWMRKLLLTISELESESCACASVACVFSMCK